MRILRNDFVAKQMNGGGDGGESNSPSKRGQARRYYRHIRRFDDAPAPFTGGVHGRLTADLSRPLAASGPEHPGYIAPASAVGVGYRGVATLFRRPEQLFGCQLHCCRLINEGATTSACTPAQPSPVETTHPHEPPPL
jgi:hypothetical protein